MKDQQQLNPPRSDEKQMLSHRAILEGAPPLSEQWQLFDNNHDLFEAACAAQAATVIFSLMQNNQIDDLARQIHTLRFQHGTGHENRASLRTIK